MSVDNTPRAWLGKGYALASSIISIPTGTQNGVTSVGTFTVSATTGLFTTSGTNYLSVGDIVRLAASGGGVLPTGFSAATDYYVTTIPSATTLTLAATKGGATIVPSDTGTAPTLTMYASGVLQEVTDTEANATTGDMRKVLWGICERLWTYWNALATADKPAKMTLRKSTFTNPDTNEVTATYTLEFKLTPGSMEVTSE